MPANGSVPLARVNIFMCRTLLEEEIAPVVEDQHMNSLMKEARIAVALTPRRLTDHPPAFVNYVKNFLSHENESTRVACEWKCGGLAL